MSGRVPDREGCDFRVPAALGVQPGAEVTTRSPAQRGPGLARDTVSRISQMLLHQDEPEVGATRNVHSRCIKVTSVCRAAVTSSVTTLQESHFPEREKT